MKRVKKTKPPSQNQGGKTLWFWRDFVLGGLVVAVFGIVLTFIYTEWSQQRNLNQVTQQKLKTALLESAYNYKTIKNAIELYTKDQQKSASIVLKSPSVVAATVAFQDENIRTVLSWDKVSFLKAYIDQVESVNRAINWYNNYILNLSTPQKIIISMEDMRSVLAEALAMCHLMLDEFQGFYEHETLIEEEMNAREKRSKELQENILNGDYLL